MPEWERRWRQSPAGKAHKQRQNQKQRERFKAARREAIAHYGGRCVCGADEGLQIDHIEGNGAEHRAMESGVRSGRIGLWLKKRGWPQGFRVLCATCNKKDYHITHKKRRAS